MNFSGLGLHLGNLSRLSKAQTHSISAENFNRGKGQSGRDGSEAEVGFCATS